MQHADLKGLPAPIPSPSGCPQGCHGSERPRDETPPRRRGSAVTAENRDCAGPKRRGPAKPAAPRRGEESRLLLTVAAFGGAVTCRGNWPRSSGRQQGPCRATSCVLRRTAWFRHSEGHTEDDLFRSLLRTVGFLDLLTFPESLLRRCEQVFCFWKHFSCALFFFFPSKWEKCV